MSVNNNIKERTETPSGIDWKSDFLGNMKEVFKWFPEVKVIYLCILIKFAEVQAAKCAGLSKVKVLIT